MGPVDRLVVVGWSTHDIADATRLLRGKGLEGTALDRVAGVYEEAALELMSAHRVGLDMYERQGHAVVIDGLVGPYALGVTDPGAG